MPKLKTKSSVKKRFKLTGTGKIMRAHSFKQHNMRKRSSRMLRQSMGMTLVHKTDVHRLLPFMQG